jgi:hypothetical protein
MAKLVTSWFWYPLTLVPSANTTIPCEQNYINWEGKGI